MTESQLFALLKLIYPEDTHVLLPHVRNATGAGGSRTADAVAFGLWPSRGLEVEGFEFKDSRSDWLRELQKPQKADPVFKFCDRWWLVVSNEKIVLPGELPSTWGLMVHQNGALIKKTLAPKLQPVDLSKTFIASLLRSFQKTTVPTCLIDSKIEAAKKEGEETSSWRQAQLQSDLDSMKKMVQEFEDASNIRLNRWDAGKLGAAVSFVMENGTEGVLRRMTSLRDQLKNMYENVEAGVEEATRDLSLLKQEETAR